MDGDDAKLGVYRREEFPLDIAIARAGGKVGITWSGASVEKGGKGLRSLWFRGQHCKSREETAAKAVEWSRLARLVGVGGHEGATWLFRSSAIVIHSALGQP